MDTVEFVCPACNKTLKMQARFAGRTGRCPNCNTRIIVPQPEEAQQAEAEQPETSAPKWWMPGKFGHQLHGAPVVAEQAADQDSSPPPGVIECKRCSQRSPGGTIRCPRCGTCLRPLFLSVFTLFVLVLQSIFVTIVLLLLVLPSQRGRFQASALTGSSLQTVKDEVKVLSDAAWVFWFFAYYCLNLKLRTGKYYAWVGIQILWAISFVSFLISNLHRDFAEGGLLEVLLMAVIYIALTAYLWRKNVRAFCSA